MEMKYASVQQGVKFGIVAGLPPEKQTSVKYQTIPLLPTNNSIK
jgi:hypothetical protein